jgi:hypothetical protein
VVKYLHSKCNVLSANHNKTENKTQAPNTILKISLGHVCMITNVNKDEILGPDCVAS